MRTVRFVASVLTLAAAAFSPVLADYYATKEDARKGRLSAEPSPGKDGSDDCSVITPLPDPQGGSAEDSGTTIDQTNTVNEIPLGCNGLWSQVRGPDQIYTFDVTAGNSLTFTVSTGNRFYDLSIYVLSVCGDGATCVTGADNCTANEFIQVSPCQGTNSTEVLAAPELAPGTYFFYVDSFYSSTANPLSSQGSYSLTVDGNLPVELIEFSVE